MPTHALLLSIHDACPLYPHLKAIKHGRTATQHRSSLHPVRHIRPIETRVSALALTNMLLVLSVMRRLFTERLAVDSSFMDPSLSKSEE